MIRVLSLGLTWIVLFSLAFVVPRFIEPTGSGFTRGTNRLPVVFGLHCLSFIVALITAVLTYRSKAEIDKWLVVVGFTPLILSLLLIIFVVVFVFLAMFAGI